MVHVLLNNYLYELEDGSADRKAYNSTLRRLRDRKRELEEDIEVTNKELEKINTLIEEFKNIDGMIN